MIILYLLIILILWTLYYYLQTESFDNNKISKNNSFNNYGIKYIRPLLNDKKWTKYVDKLKFKELCTKLNIKTFKTLYILKNPNDLYKIYDKLTNKFVLKSNKAWNRNLLVKNKNDYTVKQMLSKLSNYDDEFNSDTEPHYNYTKGQLYIEEFIDPIPEDIKIIIYKGKPTLLWINSDRFNNHKKDIYKIQNNKLKKLKNCYWNYKSTNENNINITNIIKKNKVKKMLDIAKLFNVNLPLYRVDLYWYKNDFYGGEITLSSANFNGTISENCAKISVGK